MTGHTHLNPSKKELYVVCEGADVLNHHFLLVLVIVERSQFTFFVLRILEENKRASSLKRNTKDYSWQNQIRIRCLNIDTPAVDDIIFNELLNLITQLCLYIQIQNSKNLYKSIHTFCIVPGLPALFGAFGLWCTTQVIALIIDSQFFSWH